MNIAGNSHAPMNMSGKETSILRLQQHQKQGTQQEQCQTLEAQGLQSTNFWPAAALVEDSEKKSALPSTKKTSPWPKKGKIGALGRGSSGGGASTISAVQSSLQLWARPSEPKSLAASEPATISATTAANSSLSASEVRDLLSSHFGKFLIHGIL